MKWIVIILIVSAVAAFLTPLRLLWQGRTPPNYRQAEVTRGPIVSVINSTGTVQPVLSVSVGAFVSGPIDGLFVDFNDIVKKGDLLARIDPQIYKANVARDQATLLTRRAEKDRAVALLQQASNDEGRAVALRKENRSFISDAEMDQFKFNHVALKAQLGVAEAAVTQAEAALKLSEVNMGYTEIRSPVDGIVIERKIDQGQTLAAQFQTPELFIVAPDLKTMHIIAAVDEADIGAIHEAKQRGLPVRFTVDAYPGDLFDGKIVQIRLNATTTQNVVTYPVVVAAANPNLRLKPKMTASLSFQTDDVKDVLRVPNVALRFLPRQREQVRPEDRKLLDGTALDAPEDNDSAKARLSAAEKAEARRNRNRRHVWVVDGEFLKAVEVITGLSDNEWTQIVSGDLAEGQKLVTGIP